MGFDFHTIGCALRYIVQITNEKIKAILEIQKNWRYVIFSQKSCVISHQIQVGLYTFSDKFVTKKNRSAFRAFSGFPYAPHNFFL